MFAVFQIPNQEVLALIEQGQKVKAIKVWQGQDHKLLNGVRVRPRLQRCMDMIRAVELGFWDIPLCIPVDGYTVCPRIAGDNWD
jgi:hypothetical protein